MDHTTQVAIARKLLAWRGRNETQVAPPVMANPVAAFLDPDQFEAEKQSLFKELPIVVGLSARLAAPGDFLTNDDTGVPILVVRQESGELRAFINACRHRGTLLVGAARGQCERQFVCPYHNWSYGLDGALETIPQEFGFPALDKATRGLVSLGVAERFGLIWVLPTPGRVLDLDGYLGGPLCAELASYGFEVYHPFQVTRIPAAMNWKLLYDTFLEFYHASFTHAATLRHLMAPNLVHFEALGPHYRMVAAKRSIGELERQPEASWNLLDHAVVSYAIFPNLAINFHGDHVAFYRVFPDPNSIGESYWDFDMLTPGVLSDPKARRYFEKNFTYVVDTGAEDVEMGERIQRTLASGANEHVLFGGFEPILTWFHTEVARRAGGPGPVPLA